MKRLIVRLLAVSLLGALAIYAAYVERGRFAIGGEWLLLVALIVAVAIGWKGEK